jgi:soluble lytic murein transglycosylase-like protein
VDPHLVRAVIKAESDFNSQARSHKGAQGLMQLMPDTARLHNVGNVYDPNENIDGGVRHLRMLLDRYAGDLQLTLAAYNAGIKAVEQYRGVPPFSETREYIRRVLDYHQRYRGNGKVSIRQTKQ